jgi:hypothetical protein
MVTDLGRKIQIFFGEGCKIEAISGRSKFLELAFSDQKNQLLDAFKN